MGDESILHQAQQLGVVLPYKWTVLTLKRPGCKCKWIAVQRDCQRLSIPNAAYRRELAQGQWVYVRGMGL
jgi:hypothetical protein